MTMRWREIFSLRNVTILALTIAVVSFLFIHDYSSGRGVIWNALHGEIYLTQPCAYSPWTGSRLAIGTCDTRLGYRWILAGLCLLVSAAVLVHVNRPKSN